MTETKTKTVACPTCGRLVEWRPEQRFRPFCSERCKLIDLGEWAAERYRVSAEGDPLSEEVAPNSGLAGIR